MSQLIQYGVGANVKLMFKREKSVLLLRYLRYKCQIIVYQLYIQLRGCKGLVISKENTREIYSTLSEDLEKVTSMD